MRADAVAAGCEPEAVRRLAAQLDARGHPYGAVEDALETAGLPASADVLVYVDAATLYRQPAVARALFGVLRQAGVAFTVLKETQSSGKALAMLGCLRQAAAAARATAGRIRAAGCRTVVCPSPSAFDAFANDYASLGAPLEGVSVQHSSTFLAGLFESGALKPARPGRPVAYLDSDYLKNYNALAEAPRALLRRAGCEVADFGTNREESYSLGEGAEVLDLLYPGIVKAMLGRVLDLARRDGCPALAVSSPYTLHVLRQAGEPGLRVDSVEELVAECVLIQPGNPAGARRGGRVE